MCGAGELSTILCRLLPLKFNLILFNQPLR